MSDLIHIRPVYPKSHTIEKSKIWRAFFQPRNWSNWHSLSSTGTTQLGYCRLSDWLKDGKSSYLVISNVHLYLRGTPVSIRPFDATDRRILSAVGSLLKAARQKGTPLILTPQMILKYEFNIAKPNKNQIESVIGRLEYFRLFEAALDIGTIDPDQNVVSFQDAPAHVRKFWKFREGEGIYKTTFSLLPVETVGDVIINGKVNHTGYFFSEIPKFFSYASDLKQQQSVPNEKLFFQAEGLNPPRLSDNTGAEILENLFFAFGMKNRTVWAWNINAFLIESCGFSKEDRVNLSRARSRLLQELTRLKAAGVISDFKITGSGSKKKFVVTPLIVTDSCNKSSEIVTDS